VEGLRLRVRPAPEGRVRRPLEESHVG